MSEIYSNNNNNNNDKKKNAFYNYSNCVIDFMIYYQLGMFKRIYIHK